MTIVIGCDNAAVKMKNALIRFLEAQGVTVEDVGCASSDDLTNYPTIAKRACERIMQSHYRKRGVLVCGTGIGMSLAANKVHGIRAAAVSEVYSAKLTRQHNDANIVCIGARVIGPETAKMIVEAFLTTPFEGGRHQKRVDMITDIENRESK